MREAGRMVAEILAALERLVAPGISTWELDQEAEKRTLAFGARPAFKGYMGFPASLCASVNDEVVHGIPSKKRVLLEGDLMKLDFGVEYAGFFGDSARTVKVGKVSKEAELLVRATKAALQAAIRAMVPGGKLGDLGAAVQAEVEPRGFSVVEDFTGHGIGRRLHEAPQVPNLGRAGKGMTLKAGMVLAVEPMVNAGTADVDVLEDGWTAVTVDGRLSAHFEHTVLVTEDGPQILTQVG